MTMPKHISDQVAAYHAHTTKAQEHLSKANYHAKKLLRERGFEPDAQDHDYRWNILGEKCPESPLGVHVVDTNGIFLRDCIFCKEYIFMP